MTEPGSMRSNRSRATPWVLTCLAVLPLAVKAQVPTELPPVEVIGASPLLGSGADRNKVPAATNVPNSAQAGGANRHPAGSQGAGGQCSRREPVRRRGRSERA